MEDIKLSVEAIRLNLKLSREEMAEKLGMTLDRYNRIAIGKSKMYATELMKLEEVSNITGHNILLP